MITLHHNDCIDQMKQMIDAGQLVDSILTDPPYHIESIIKRFSKVSQSDDTQTSQHLRDDAHQYARLAKNFAGQDWDGGQIAFEKSTWELAFQLSKPGGYLLALCEPRSDHKLASAIEAAGFEIRDKVFWLYGTGFPKSHKQPNGQGTRIKPAVETIVMARKPHKGTVWSNIQEHGTGGLNIDPCRTAHGTFPTNIIHDGSDDVIECFDKYGSGVDRFFYSTKTSKKEKGADNNHPTVKPIALMRYLIKLVTPVNGTVFDPFMGSGSTGLAAIDEERSFIGIEQSEAYFKIAQDRLNKHKGVLNV